MQVTDFLGSAAFSQAVQALDIKTGNLVCLKIIKVSGPLFWCSTVAFSAAQFARDLTYPTTPSIETRKVCISTFFLTIHEPLQHRKRVLFC